MPLTRAELGQIKSLLITARSLVQNGVARAHRGGNAHLAARLRAIEAALDKELDRVHRALSRP